MRVVVVLTGLLVSAAFLAPADQPPIRFPEIPAPPPPKPKPPEPTDITKLGAGQLYVIDSDIPCVVLGSPEGVVKITAEVGPLTIYAQFVDGVRPETRTYQGKFVFLVEARETGRVELITIPHAFKFEKDIIRKTIEVDSGKGPRPPPGPKPEPSPIPYTGLRALIVVETGQPISQGQFSAIYGQATRDYLNTHCAKADGVPEWRIYDKDQDLSKVPKMWANAMKRPRESTPWLLLSNGQGGYEGPVPNSSDEMIKLLQKLTPKEDK